MKKKQSADEWEVGMDTHCCQITPYPLQTGFSVSNLPVTEDRQSTDLMQDVHGCGTLETLPVSRRAVGMFQRQTGLCADLPLPLLVH